MASDFTTGSPSVTSDGEDRNLISADKVQGTAVYNHDDEKLGTIDSIYIDKRNGEVAYVVMSFGGFLGIGEKFHPLPWDLLDYDTRVGGYRVDLDRDDLLDAPSYDRAAMSDYDFDTDAGGVDDYYTQRFQHADEITGGDHQDDSEAGIDPDRRSDANDGINRPLGFYSTQAQADRNGGTPGAHATNETAGGPSFRSPEQQAIRNESQDDDATRDRTAPIEGSSRVATGAEGARAVEAYEQSDAGRLMPDRDQSNDRVR